MSILMAVPNGAESASQHINDRILWFGAGVLLLVAIDGIAHGLRHMVELNAIKSTGPSSVTDKSTNPEESIALSTLSALYTSPNREISRSAMSLLLDRLAKSSEEVQAWIDDHFSHSPMTRQSARLLRDLLRDLPYYPPHQHEKNIARLAQLTLLMDTAAPQDKPEAKTIRAAYDIIRDSRPFQAPLWLLIHLSVTLEVRKVTPQWICVGLKKPQFLPWIRAMRCVLLLQELPLSRQQKTRAALDQAMLDLRRAEGVAVNDNDKKAKVKWHRDALSLLAAGRDPLSTDYLQDEDMSGQKTQDHYSKMQARLRSMLAPHTRQARFHEESPEETEVRRRRREAMVFHDGSGVVDPAQAIIFPPHSETVNGFTVANPQ